MEAGTYIDPAEDYEVTAEYVAKHFGCAIDAQLIRAGLIVPQHVLDSIEDNPHQWTARVNAYLQAMA